MWPQKGSLTPLVLNGPLATVGSRAGVDRTLPLRPRQPAGCRSADAPSLPSSGASTVHPASRSWCYDNRQPQPPGVGRAEPAQTVQPRSTNAGRRGSRTSSLTSGGRKFTIKVHACTRPGRGCFLRGASGLSPPGEGQMSATSGHWSPAARRVSQSPSRHQHLGLAFHTQLGTTGLQTIAVGQEPQRTRWNQRNSVAQMEI